MSFLQTADKNEVIRYDTPHDENTPVEDIDFIELRATLSKGEANSISQANPTPKVDEEGKPLPDIDGGIRFLEKFFTTCAVRWSLKDKLGLETAPSIERYRDLTLEAGRWIDQVLSEHIQIVFGTKAAALEGKLETTETTSSTETEKTPVE